jgi:hypothetical protein
MNLALTDVQDAVRDTARRAARELLAPEAARNDAEERFPEQTLRALGRLGLMGINVPAEFGGAEAGAVAYALAVRELAQGCAGTTVALMVTNMVAETIARFGSEAQKRRYLPSICGGEWPAASFCLSEPGAGSDASALTTTATRDGDHYMSSTAPSHGSPAAATPASTSSWRAPSPAARARASAPSSSNRGPRACPRLTPRTSSGCAHRTPRRLSSTTAGCRPRPAHRRRRHRLSRRHDRPRRRAHRRQRPIPRHRHGGFDFGRPVRHPNDASSVATCHRVDPRRPVQRQIADSAIGARGRLAASACGPRLSKRRASPMSREAAMAKVYCAEMPPTKSAAGRSKILRRVRWYHARVPGRTLTCATCASPGSTKGTSEVQRIVIARETLRLMASGQ